jgi:hypothetical protein
MNIFDIELKYKKELEAIKEWPYLRTKLGFLLKNKDNKKNLNNKQKKIGFVKSFFYGFKNWFNKYECIVFSDSSQRKFIKGKYFDKNFDYIINSSKYKTLLIERPNLEHYDIKKVYTNFIVSSSILKIIIELLSFFMINPNFKLPKILNIYKNQLIKRYKICKAEEIVYKILLKVYNPKIIFVSCYNCQHGLIKIANELNINIIEVQHGVINDMHFSYKSKLDMDKIYFPSTLLSFGDNERNIDSTILQNVIPVGSYYLDFLLNNFTPQKSLISIIEKFNLSFGISMQNEEWEEKVMIDFIKRQALQNPNFLFIIIPRMNIININEINLPNVILYPELDCYQIILHCNAHISLYSSCALEAPTLGIPNILINEKNKYASKYYSELLSSINTSIISTDEEFTSTLRKLINTEKSLIKNSNSSIFKNNYIENIDNFIKNLK